MPHFPICGMEAADFQYRKVWTEEMLALCPPWSKARTHEEKVLGLSPGL